MIRPAHLASDLTTAPGLHDIPNARFHRPKCLLSPGNTFQAAFLIPLDVRVLMAPSKNCGGVIAFHCDLD